MGQKVNPHGLRVGIIKDWDSHWFVEKKDFAANVKEDNEIRNVLKKKYYQAAISKIAIEKAASLPIKKVLMSAAANAEHNLGMSKDSLFVAACYADQGPTLKRIMARAQGRAFRILKRTSHITVVLDAKA